MCVVWRFVSRYKCENVWTAHIISFDLMKDEDGQEFYVFLIKF